MMVWYSLGTPVRYAYAARHCASESFPCVCKLSTLQLLGSADPQRMSLPDLTGGLCAPPP